jgi:hypothetical protein
MNPMKYEVEGIRFDEAEAAYVHAQTIANATGRAVYVYQICWHATISPKQQ